MASKNRLPLEGQVALVTGAGSGIGHAIARRLLAAGAQVALHYRSRARTVQRLAAQYDRRRCCVIKTDFENPSSAEELFDSVWSWRRRIDILVNNAALIEPVASPADIGQADLARALQVNCIAPLLLSKLAWLKMRRARSGRIVSLSSIGVKYAGSCQTTPYMISKAALEAGMAALAKAAAPDGVLINVVRPGVTITAAHRRLGRRDLSRRITGIPLGRAARPVEIGEAVLFLVSPRNTYITGAVIPVAGGE